MIWVRSWRCACLVTWFCYQMIAKPGNKTGPPAWPDPGTCILISKVWLWAFLYHDFQAIRCVLHTFTISMHSFNTLRLRQNGYNFADNIFFKSMWMKLHWNLFPRVQISMISHIASFGSDDGLVLNRWSHCMNQSWWLKCVSLSCDEMMSWWLPIYIQLGPCQGDSMAFKNGGNSHWSRELIMHCNLSIIQCRWGASQSIFGSTNHIARGNPANRIWCLYRSTLVE